MEYTFQEEQIKYLQLCAREVLRQEETTDLIVPDSSPDAVCVLDSFAVVSVRSTECLEGSVQISGGIQAGVLYQAENEEQPRLLETYLPFTMRKEMACSTGDSSAVIHGSAVGCDARILNSRKILLRFDIGCVVELYQDKICSIFQPEQTDMNLQVLPATHSVRLYQQITRKLFAVEELIDLPAGHITMEQLIHCQPKAQITESRAAGNKVIFKGYILLDMMYRSVDNTLEHWTAQVPFSQFCECADDCDASEPRVVLQLSGCDVRIEQEDQISFNIMYLIQCQTDRAATIPVIADAYHLQGQFLPQKQTCDLSCVLQRQSMNQSLRLKGRKPMQVVLDARITPGIPEVRSDRIVVPVTVHVFGTAEDGTYVAEQIKGEAGYPHTMPDKGCFAVPTVCADVYVIPGNDGSDVRFSIDLDVQWHEHWQMETICGGTLAETADTKNDRPPLILRRLPVDMSVWDIAKTSGTTTQQICQANQIPDETVPAGTFVLIPLR